MTKGPSPIEDLSPTFYKSLFFYSFFKINYEQLINLQLQYSRRVRGHMSCQELVINITETMWQHINFYMQIQVRLISRNSTPSGKQVKYLQEGNKQPMRYKLLF